MLQLFLCKAMFLVPPPIDDRDDTTGDSEGVPQSPRRFWERLIPRKPWEWTLKIRRLLRPPIG